MEFRECEMEEMVRTEDLFNGVYEGKKVLLTGHTGFKGSWLYTWLSKLGADVTGLSLGLVSTPSHYSLLDLSGQSIVADIRDASSLENALTTSQPDIVFHLAAQPLVRKSYANPLETFHTNVLGTVNLFEAIRKTPSVKAVVNITTDKVYRNKEDGIAYRETDILGGHDPYSTSKACVELVHESYIKSFFNQSGTRAVTARAGNVIGGGDWAEDRLIPDLMRAGQNNESLNVRNPDSIRPWQHVLDPLSGYLLLGMHLLMSGDRSGTAWNFGPDAEDCVPVICVLEIFKQHWSGISWNDVSEKAALHESGILRLDCTNAKESLSWGPTWNIGKAIEKTAQWYRQYYMDGKISTEKDLEAYIADAISDKAVWTI